MRGWSPAAAALALLALALPFEPRAPLFTAAGLGFTVPEVLAAAAAALLLRERRRGAAPATAPLAALAAFAAAGVLSAALASEPAAALKFSLRLVAASVLATLVAAAPAPVRSRWPPALAAGGVVVGLAALAEAGGLRGLDPVLDAFRDGPFVVGDLRRATGGTAHPNLAASALGAALVVLASRPGRAAVAGLAVAGLGLLATASRSGLLAAVAGLAALAVLRPAPRPRRALAALLFGLALLAVLEPRVRLRLGSEDAGEWYGAVVTPSATELALRPGERTSLRLRAENAGAQAWTPESFLPTCRWYPGSALLAPSVAPPPRSFAAGPRLEGADGTGLRDDHGRRLSGRVAAGGATDAEVPLLAPAQPGRFLLACDVVHPYAGWLSAWAGRPALVRVRVGDPAEAPPSLSPPTLRAAAPQPRGRAELWAAALALWRERPLLGVGPDAFRRRVGDGRTSASSLYLEVLATSGLMGAAALLAVLLSTLRAARARGHVVPAALLATIAVQGLFDYLLGSTGVYLVLALVVGTAAAPEDPA